MPLAFSPACRRPVREPVQCRIERSRDCQDHEIKTYQVCDSDVQGEAVQKAYEQDLPEGITARLVEGRKEVAGRENEKARDAQDTSIRCVNLSEVPSNVVDSTLIENHLHSHAHNHHRHKQSKKSYYSKQESDDRGQREKTQAINRIAESDNCGKDGKWNAIEGYEGFEPIVDLILKMEEAQIGLRVLFEHESRWVFVHNMAPRTLT